MRVPRTRSSMLRSTLVTCIALMMFLPACRSVPKVSPSPALVPQHVSGYQAQDPAAAAELEGGDGLTGGNRVTLLWDGPQTVAAMTDAILKARDHVNIETFIFRDDEVGRPLADLLLRKQSEGVQVNLVYDSFGALRTPDEFFERLRAGGVNVLEFNPVNPIDRVDSSARTDGLTINNRNHRKLMVVDGKIGFTGGINFHREYSNSSSAVTPAPEGRQPQYFWRDTHVRIEGPVVADMQRSFLAMWRASSREPLPNRRYFPTVGPRGPDRVGITIASPHDDVSKIYATYIAAIRNARRTIHLTHAYLVPTRELLDALTDAARGGVEVKLILPGFSDFWMPRAAGHSYYEDLLDAGVRIFERHGAMLHAKAAVIDGTWSTVGSSNLDFRSAIHDAEVNAVIVGAEFGRQMEDMFRFDLEHSQEITLSEWQQRPVSDRLREWVARLFKYWL